MKTERGMASLLLIFLLLFLTGTLSLLTAEAIALLKSYQISRHGEQLRKKLSYSLLSSRNSTATSESLEGSHGEMKMRVQSQLQLSLGGKKLYQLSTQSFQNESCPSESLMYLKRIPRDLTEAKRTVVSTLTCTLDGTPDTRNFSTRGNIELRNLIVNRAGTTTLLSQGYISIDNLSVESDLLIIGAGSIYIGTAQFIGEGFASLISLSGEIKISRASCTDSIYLDSYLTPMTPTCITPRNTTPHLQSSKGWITGITTSEF